MKNIQALAEKTTENDHIHRFTLRTLVYAAHDQVVAYALDSDLMGTGFDEEEAIETLRQTLKVFLEDAANHGAPEDLLQRQAHPSFFEHWKNPPAGVEAGYLSMSLRLEPRAGLALEPPKVLKCA
jgi:hypothetical protein